MSIKPFMGNLSSAPTIWVGVHDCTFTVAVHSSMDIHHTLEIPVLTYMVMLGALWGPTLASCSCFKHSRYPYMVPTICLTLSKYPSTALCTQSLARDLTHDDICDVSFINSAYNRGIPSAMGFDG